MPIEWGYHSVSLCSKYIILKYTWNFKCVQIQRCEKLQKPQMQSAGRWRLWMPLSLNASFILPCWQISSSCCDSLGPESADCPKNRISSAILLRMKPFQSQMPRYQQVHLWAVIQNNRLCFLGGGKWGPLSCFPRVDTEALVSVFASPLVACTLLIPWPIVCGGWGMPPWWCLWGPQIRAPSLCHYGLVYFLPPQGLGSTPHSRGRAKHFIVSDTIGNGNIFYISWQFPTGSLLVYRSALISADWFCILQLS